MIELSLFHAIQMRGISIIAFCCPQGYGILKMETPAGGLN